jgi:hypothetical protein
MAKRQINKAEMVRNYQTAHPDARPTAVASALKEYGVTPNYVSAIKNKMKVNAGGQRRSRRGRTAVSETAINGSVEAIVSAAKFIKSCGGLAQAREAFRLAERVVAAVQS